MAGNGWHQWWCDPELSKPLQVLSSALNSYSALLT
ncbi:hypothetical protein CPS_1299 [Colwellia psychrerythraea 34H]|uniref:Uncharacterized protein n=1 Tax=Colwellia psychrerythraea (strain 34H / ATCC BAA-681) TaxID=167879 RepID=Q486H3_COLP3|nr:hypothetical protein CPS_1299 [Colwellia psychrerythraea 34H]